MQIDSILNEFVDVALEVEAKMTVTQAEVFKIVFVANLKHLQSSNLYTANLMDEVGLLQGTEIVDDLQGRDIYPLRLEITADIVGRKEVSYIVGGIKDKRLQKIHVADAFPLDYILEKNGGKDIAKVFENNLLLLRQIRQIGQSSEGEIVA